MHGEIAEVQQHLVGGELLLRHILPVQHNDGHAQEKVEVVRLQKTEYGQREKMNGAGCAYLGTTWTVSNLCDRKWKEKVMKKKKRFGTQATNNHCGIE